MNFVHIFFAIFIITLFNSCTLVGALIGASKDNDKFSPKQLSYSSFESGTPIILINNIDERFYGDLIQIEYWSENEKKEKFEKFLKYDLDETPSINDTVTIMYSKTRLDYHPYIFKGFKFDGILLKYIGSHTEAFYHYTNIVGLRNSNDHKVNINKVYSYSEYLTFPVSITMNINEMDRTFSASEIKYLKKNTNYWLVGAQMGALIDITVTLTYLFTMKHLGQDD